MFAKLSAVDFFCSIYRFFKELYLTDLKKCLDIKKNSSQLYFYLTKLKTDAKIKFYSLNSML